jgi:hypothetical protein
LGRKTHRGGGLSWKKKLLFGIVTCVLVLGGLEGGARLLLDDPPAASLWIDRRRDAVSHWLPEQWDVYVGDPVLSWRNRPNLDREMDGVRYRINELGLRGGPVPRHKPPGVYRVLSLGESTTYGFGVPEEHSYGSVLERCLNHRRDDFEYQVLNAGVISYTMVQSLLYLEHEGLSFEPDAILLYHGVNEFLRAGHMRRRVEIPAEEFQGLTDWELLGSPDGPIEMADASLLRASRLYRWMAYWLRSAEPEDPGQESQGTVRREPVRRVPEPDRIRVLERLQSLSQEKGIQLLVIVPAYLEFDRHRSLLLGFTRDRDIHRFDAETVISGLGGERSAHFQDRFHPTSETHAALGQALCGYMDERLISVGAGGARP